MATARFASLCFTLHGTALTRHHTHAPWEVATEGELPAWVINAPLASHGRRTRRIRHSCPRDKIGPPKRLHSVVALPLVLFVTEARCIKRATVSSVGKSGLTTPASITIS